MAHDGTQFAAIAETTMGFRRQVIVSLMFSAQARELSADTRDLALRVAYRTIEQFSMCTY
jgi:hypothetical protein